MNLVGIRPWDVASYTAFELMDASRLAEFLMKRGPLG